MKQKQRPLQVVAREILKKYEEHEKMLIKMTSKSIEEQDLRLGFLRVNVGMYENEIERASALEAPKRGKWELIRIEDDGNGFYCCTACGAGDIHHPDVKVPYCWKCGAPMDAGEDE